MVEMSTNLVCLKSLEILSIKRKIIYDCFKQILRTTKDIYQYVYAHVFPKIYSTTEKRGIDLKSNFHILFKSYRDKAILRQHQTITSTKNPANFENKREETSEFEQKPIKKFNEFSDGEEEELKEQTKKGKQIRREQSQESKSEKLKLKQEEVKKKRERNVGKAERFE